MIPALKKSWPACPPVPLMKLTQPSWRRAQHLVVDRPYLLKPALPTSTKWLRASKPDLTNWPQPLRVKSACRSKLPKPFRWVARPSTGAKLRRGGAGGGEWEKKVAGPMGSSLNVREPSGVVGCITMWNFPLSQITLKIATAMGAGCTVVLKLSEIAPFKAMILAAIIHEAGLPPVMFNLVNGVDPVVGEVLANHPEVDVVSFTGSTRAGKRVSELASQSVKRMALELGGKPASIVLDSANFEAAVKGTVAACMLNSGQTCSAHTRMLVPAARYDEVKALAQAAVARFSLGSSLDEGSKLGPLASAMQRD